MNVKKEKLKQIWDRHMSLRSIKSALLWVWRKYLVVKLSSSQQGYFCPSICTCTDGLQAHHWILVSLPVASSLVYPDFIPKLFLADKPSQGRRLPPEWLLTWLHHCKPFSSHWMTVTSLRTKEFILLFTDAVECINWGSSAPNQETLKQKTAVHSMVLLACGYLRPWSWKHRQSKSPPTVDDTKMGIQV